MFDMRHSKVVRWLAIRIALLPVLFVLASGASYLVVYGVGPGPSYACLSRGCPERDESRGVGLSLVSDYSEWLGHAVRGDLGEVYIGCPLSFL